MESASSPEVSFKHHLRFIEFGKCTPRGVLVWVSRVEPTDAGMVHHILTAVDHLGTNDAYRSWQRGATEFLISIIQISNTLM